MIESLYVKNIALIKELELEPEPGLNVLTGETGAGKSIIIDSLNFVLGDRADRSLISYGESSATVRVSFTGLSETVRKLLEEYGIDPEEPLNVRRTMSENGRGDVRINNVPVTVQQLRRIMSGLVSVHSQHESQAVLDESNHLGLLDKYRSRGIYDGLSEKYRRAYSAYKAALKELDAFENEAARERKIDLLRYEIDEINSVSPQEGEEEELLEKRSKARNAERIISGIQAALTLLEGSDEGFGALNAVVYAVRELRAMERFADFGEYTERLENVITELKDVAGSLKAESEAVFMDPSEADAVDRRLDDIRKIIRRYGKIAELAGYLENAEKELDKLLHAEERIEELKNEADLSLSEALKYAAELRTERQRAAKEFSAAIESNLKALGMKNASFEVAFGRSGSISESDLNDCGADTVRFLISPNLGEPLKPLAKIASGGEASRFMLGLKRVTADLEGTDVLVFDEIDTGISGKIAMVVAEKLSDISFGHQVIAVTHLPQLTAMADANFLIEKSESDFRTHTDIKRLNEEECLSELSRLQGSVGPDELSYRNALELKNWANSYKKSRKR